MKLDISHYWETTAVPGMDHLGCYLTGASHLFVLVHMKWRGSQGSDLSLSKEETSARGSFPSDAGAAGGEFWVLLPQTCATQSNFHPSSILLHFTCSNLSPQDSEKEGQVTGVADSEWAERCIRI